MAKSTIEWTDYTFNPWWGCTAVSPGCKHCYAEAWAKRTGYDWGPNAPRRLFGDAHWNGPLLWNAEATRAGARRRVFCASMADVFEALPSLADARTRLFRLIEATPALDWLILTKRPENVIPLAAEGHFGRPWPDNVWLGVSVEDELRARRRMPIFAAVRDALAFSVGFISYEPALELVDFRPYLSSVEWLIVGGESGNGARPFDPAWARAAVTAARDAGVAPFVKQLGKEPIGELIQLRSKKAHDKNGDMSKWPEDLRIREWPRARPSRTMKIVGAST